MRSVIKIQSNINKHGLQGSIETQLTSDWKIPADEESTVKNLIERVYEDYKPEILRMRNFAFAHRNINTCDMLVSYKDNEIEIRIFHDHIETLREITGKFLKRFYDLIIKPNNHSFVVNEPITISEAQKNNILDNGIKALSTMDYIKKVYSDRQSEFIFLCIIFPITIGMLIFIIVAYPTPEKNTLFYEFISKIAGPFLASSLLTLTNLIIYYSKLKTNTNIIWGM